MTTPNLSYPVLTVGWNVTYDGSRDIITQSDTIWSVACLAFVISLLSFGVWCSGMCKHRNNAYGTVHYTDVPQKNRILDILKGKAKFLPMFRRLRKHRKDTDEENLLDNSSKSSRTDSSDESDYDDNVDIVFDRSHSHIIDL